MDQGATLICMARREILFILFVGCALLSLSLHTRPIGYLHSWNQITTLTHIVAIVENPFTWSLPYDTVTRLPPADTAIVVAPPFNDFRIFEEFPLYHILSAVIARLGITAENAGRILSLAFWALGACGMYAFGRPGRTFPLHKNVAWLTLLLYCCSFPVAYYGVAIMSDTAMVTLWTWSLAFLMRSQHLQHIPSILAGLGCAALSGLFKSYGLLSLVPWILTALGTFKDTLAVNPHRSTIRLMTIAFGVAVASAPTLCWHLFAILHSGHQEFESHSLSRKLSILATGGFWNALQKGYFRYLSYLPGALVIVAGIFWLRAKRYCEVPSVIWMSAATGVVFTLATADKIPHHDYYLLMPAIPLFVIAAHIVNFAVGTLPARYRTSTLAVIFIAISIPSFLNVRKALSENRDVLACADLVVSRTSVHDLVGVYSDISRYNSIIFYARRFGLRIEGTELPLHPYHSAGARYVVTNLTHTEFERFDGWLVKQNARNIGRITASDYKGHPRVCALYELAV